MPGFIDFVAIKEAVSFSDAVGYLELDLKRSGNQWRGPCPSCNAGGDRALVITEARGWYCFAKKGGGDVIGLAAHMLDIPTKDAAQMLAEKAGMVQVNRTSSNTVRSKPESEATKGSGLQPLAYLEPDHEAVVALGFDPEFCKRQGIGYAGRGVCRGSVAIPFRDEQGTLLGYLAVQDLTYLPPDFQTNVVPFQKRA